MTMDGKHRFIGVGNALQQGANGFTELSGNRIPHRIRNIDGGGSSINRRLNNAAQKVNFRTPSVLTGELHVVGITTGILNRSEEHTSNSSHVKSSYAVFCLKKKKQ